MIYSDDKSRILRQIKSGNTVKKQGFRFLYESCALSTTVYRLSGTQKKWKPCIFKVSTLFKRAADGNRTRDLRTTNATLYRLSHSSIT